MTFCEDLDYYLGCELRVCDSPNYKDENLNYPIMNLGEGEKAIEIHFLHYKTVDEAISTWNRRKERIDKDNLFVLFTFFDKADEEWVERFDKLPFTNKVCITERNFPAYPSARCIEGYPDGLGVLSLWKDLFGHKRIDGFDYVGWFNSNCR